MIARKNPSTGKWDAQYSYTDWQGKRKKTTKRGFRTKREAVEWYDHFRATQDADFNMLFKDFIEIYMEDQSHRLRQHTMMNKRFLFDKHIIPYFGNKKVNAIKAPDIRAWQNKLMATDLKPTYLKTINNQLNAVFNYAMKYDACKYILEYFENKTHQRINDFGNGRGVRNYFERLLLCQANRLALLDTVNRNDIRTLTIEDAIGASNE